MQANAQRFEKSRSVLWAFLSDGIVLHNFANHQFLELHGLAAAVWSYLDVAPDFHLHTPPLVWLELTRRCNLECPHCYIDGGLAREGEMPGSEFHRLLDEFADMGVWAVAMTGGEPTLHPDFIPLVRHARD